MWRILLLCEVSFVLLTIAAWNAVPIAHRRGGSSAQLQHRRASPLLCSAASNHDKNEEEARSIAADILQSVLVVENATKVERALKVALRSIDDGRLRKRVSQLVLGTSVMRKRHEYVHKATIATCLEQNEEKIRSLVDLHAEYLTPNTGTPSDNITWPSDTVARIAVQYSMPTFLVRLWIAEYGEEETEALCNISNTPGPITLRRNAIRCSSEQLILRLEADEGVKLSPPKFTVPGCLRITSGPSRSIWAMSAWREGWFEVQDAGSQLIVASMELDADDKIVVDCCAGNGGKSLAVISKLYQLNNSATVWAHDVEDVRLAQLRGSLSRAGASNTTIQLPTTSCAEEDLYDEMADIVLVDAPCSSCGVLRRRPSHRWGLREEAVEHELPKLQLEILKNASRLVKPGGRLVYATCSVCHCENEDVAAAWEGDASSLSSWDPWPFHYRESWPIPPERNLPSHYCKLLPHKHDSDGFFIARWKRSKE